MKGYEGRLKGLEGWPEGSEGQIISLRDSSQGLDASQQGLRDCHRWEQTDKLTVDERNCSPFLGACTRLYKPICRPVGPSVRRSVGPSVGRCSQSTRLIVIGLL